MEVAVEETSEVVAATELALDARPECRDWQRNVCTKGDKCKYKHTPKSIMDVLQRTEVCHDFQNKKVGCERHNCKYLHITKEDEEYIRANGAAPPTLSTEEMEKLEGLPPLCNDHLRGLCTRGSRCKFRHVGDPGEVKVRDRFHPYADDDSFFRDRLEMRRRYREEMMEDEIMYLKAQVSRLKRQVADLTATNETLMDENARLRLNRPRAVSPVAVANAVVGTSYTGAIGTTYTSPIDSYSTAYTSSLASDPYSAAQSHTATALAFSTALPRY